MVSIRSTDFLILLVAACRFYERGAPENRFVRSLCGEDLESPDRDLSVFFESIPLEIKEEKKKEHV